ncbi:trichohyalin-like [Hoplias malabaricus]|uniref:trichohyalin-like n=1 Tax=Hoplias malabaricus TaxID=27720 RepID=UPI003462445C
MYRNGQTSCQVIIIIITIFIYNVITRLLEVNRVYISQIVREWTEEERKKMEESALRTELKGLKVIVKDRERLLMERNEELKERDKEIQEKEKLVTNNTETLQMKDRMLQEKDSLLTETKEKLEPMSRELKEKQNILTERETELMERETQLQEKDTELENVRKMLREKESLLEDTVKEVDSCKNQLETQRKELQEKSSTLQKMKIQLEEQKTEVSEKDKQLEEKERIVSEIHTQLMEREEEVKEKERLLEERNKQLQERTRPPSSVPVRRRNSKEGIPLINEPLHSGPHAFLLVIPVKQTSGEERDMLQKMEEVFRERCWRNTMILFTVTDEDQEKRIEEFVQSGHQEVQSLVEKCGNTVSTLRRVERGLRSQSCWRRSRRWWKETERSSTAVRSTWRQKLRSEQWTKIVKEMEKRKMKEEREMKEKHEKELQNSLRRIEGAVQEHEGEIKQLNHRTTDLERRTKEERDEEKRRGLERELERELERRAEMEEKVKRLKEKRERDRCVIEERHRREMEKIMETYEGEARAEAERILMKILLPELQRDIFASKTKMQEEIIRQMEEKNMELENLREHYSELRKTPAADTNAQPSRSSGGWMCCFLPQRR